jgi:hypothetical protein
MAYDVTLDGSTFRTMMGIEPERAAEFMEEHGAHIVALNCGTGMEMERARDAVERYKSVTSLPVMVQPNAGKPRLDQHESGLRRNAGADGERPDAAAGGGRKYRGRLLRQHAGTHPRVQKSDGRISGIKGIERKEANVKVKLCDVNRLPRRNFPQHTGDKSGIGVHYVDAYIKPMNVKLEDGTPVKCKRRGLKIVLSAGAKKGEGLMRRIDVSADPVVMLTRPCRRPPRPPASNSRWRARPMGF